MGRLIYDGNSVYEIDEEAFLKKRQKNEMDKQGLREKGETDILVTHKKKSTTLKLQE